jgi:AbrB family looped-hinge helix DNA binding protein
MNTVVKVQRKGQLTIPTRLRKQVGLGDGGYVEAKAERGRIVLIPRTGRSADDTEYTAEQQRIIDSELAKADDDVRNGRVYGPFSAKQAANFLRSELKKRAGKSKKRR